MSDLWSETSGTACLVGTDSWTGSVYYSNGITSRYRRSIQPGQRDGFLSHRALAAFAAIADRLRGPSAAARAIPPFNPPRRPSATAWGFLLGSTGFTSCSGSYFWTCPVDSSRIWYASWFGSRGRACFFDRSGIPQYRHNGGSMVNRVNFQTDPIPNAA